VLYQKLNLNPTQLTRLDFGNLGSSKGLQKIPFEPALFGEKNMKKWGNSLAGLFISTEIQLIKVILCNLL
jgi:hypothetical protein